MRLVSRLLAALAVSTASGLAMVPAGNATEPMRQPLTMADILAAAPPADWRVLDPENTLYLELSAGRVIIELAPSFAPAHVANTKALVRAGYFDGSAIVRSQDNYVVQWARDAADPAPMGKASATLVAEFSRALPLAGAFTRLPDPDTYAAETGFVGGFPVARDRSAGKAWLVHCYGMVGAGRDLAADSGGDACRGRRAAGRTQRARGPAHR